MIKGAMPFLRRLRERGVKLILAIGTDHQDVVSEAQALGYAELFDGGIFGAVGDIDREAKREVIRRILCDARLGETPLACFGDGPVELREAKKRGAMAIGIASDEVRRYGLNPEKRSRLIRAGADIVAPDFSQPEILMRVLGLDG
jgi:beta-phosphoglucomutase-like phosphatase (HAD superfamily)